MSLLPIHSRKQLARLLLGGAFAVMSFVTQAQTPEIQLTQSSTSLQAQTLSELTDKVVYLDFWASWCVPCRRSFPWMNTMQAKYAEQGLVIIAINLDQERALADAFIAETQANFHIEFDPAGEYAESFGVAGMPTSLLIDKNGHIRAQHQGFFNAKTAHYEKQIQALLAE
ncbi:TlpA family protein disulfide reductase [Alteromonas sp. LMIT006]|jgi:thiol-disulfide isomerase/thioredoxin|uniref:TlpA family protein disulfide reductase n=1 Tax=Alteromonadaceae TaxID=72275 RepID=UPI0020CA6393|nr:TlpA disulfide reductase family protein [Alteromonas sp. LMIT006]UTP72299.1 TlpA family protein disulfide reductase [Alteromonas sp. LMIT006]